MNIMMNHSETSREFDEIALGSFAVYILNNRERMMPVALVDHEPHDMLNFGIQQDFIDSYGQRGSGHQHHG